MTQGSSELGFVESGFALISRHSARVVAGRYRLDELIGSGGAADVYRGFDLRLRRPVAVKVFRPGTGFDTEENLGGEAVILARLEHPGVVSAFDAGHDGDGYLVMQLVDGPTLKARISEAPLPWQTVAVLGAGLADALAHAHGAGIVHRDVKPSNILLDASGRPHLTDFGISRLLDGTTRTATGTLIGTAAYLAPEQVLGRPVGRPADVYALGLVLLECLTGRLEYDGGPLEAAIARLHRGPGIPDGIPDGFAALLRQMTDLDEHARPPAGDCARTLALLAESNPGTEATPSAPRPTEVRAPVTAGGTDRALSPESPPADTSTAAFKQPAPALAARHRVRMAGAAVAVAAIAALAVTEGTAGYTTGDDKGAPAAPVTPHTQVEETPSGPEASPTDEQPVPARELPAAAPGQGATGTAGQPAAGSARVQRQPKPAHTPAAAPGKTKAADAPRGSAKRQKANKSGEKGSAQQVEKRQRR
ncbi:MULTISPECIES: protein kinase [unclassified Streptomyces]|uniref:serine/threonine-protein kinase n=1 Tax=unclassified Streptomyces TaxID=2593676 RepID=UPI0036E040CC